MRLALAAVALVVVVGQGWAAPRCMARFVTDAHGQLDLDKVQHRGRTFGPVTQLNVDRKSRIPYVCSEDIECFPASAVELTSPCRLSASAFKDEDEDHIEKK